MLLIGLFFYLGGLVKGGDSFLLINNNINNINCDIRAVKNTYARSISLTIDKWRELEEYAEYNGISLSAAISRTTGIGLTYLKKLIAGSENAQVTKIMTSVPDEQHA